METAMVFVIGVLFAVAVYLLLSKAIVRMLIGVVILGNAANLLIFTIGRITAEIPPIVASGEYLPAEGAANPVPQALILTAIVIGFAMSSFFSVLAFRAYQDLNADDTDKMRSAEPENAPKPPLSY